MFTQALIWWPLIVAAIANVALGMIWYGPLFGKQWMKETGMTAEDAKKAKEKGMMKESLIALVTSFITAYVLAQVILLAGAFTAAEAVGVAFWLWLGFMATLLTSGVLWGDETWTLWLINAAYRLVALITMALLMFTWI